MKPRLQKLREQRDLILNHLQWIDAEIAAEQPVPTKAEASASAPASEVKETEVTPATPTSPPPAVFEADPLEETHVNSLKSDVRRGCLLYFGLAWLALGVVTVVVYLIYS